MNDRQLIADLLSALEYHTEQTRPIEFSRVAIEAAREYLRKPAQQQEPVAWIYEFYADRGHLGLAFEPQRSADNTPLYGAPQPLREWVDLTDEELEIINDCGDTDSYKFARAIEAKLREKNSP